MFVSSRSSIRSMLRTPDNFPAAGPPPPPALHDASASRLAGSVRLDRGPSALALSLLVFGIFLLVIAFLAFVPFSRVERVDGQVEPAKGIITLNAARDGIVLTIDKRVGDLVSAGDPVLVVSSEEFDANGRSRSAQITTGLLKERTLLASQEASFRGELASRLNALRAQKDSLRTQIATIKQQVQLQEELVNSAQTELDAIRVVAERGFISRRDLNSRQEILLIRQQRLAELKQAASDKLSAIETVDAQMIEAASSTSAEVGNVQVAQARVDRQEAEIGARPSFTIRSPIRGRVSNIQAQRGQSVRGGEAIVQILPKDSRPIARLKISSAAVPFIAVGQTVRLQPTGLTSSNIASLRGRVIRVGEAPLPSTGQQSQEQMFPIDVALATDVIRVDGRDRRLRAGTHVSATIILYRRSILESLFSGAGRP